MISANTLFHFTNSVDNIKNILTNHFSPRVCLERIDYFQGEKFDFGLPMVCFCDIPLSQIGNHIKTYGEFAIGLTKKWALNNGISPVLYLQSMSQAIGDINNFFELAGIKDRHSALHEPNYLISCYELFSYCKAYQGSMWRNGKLKKNIRFYDEREWRYVPNYRWFIDSYPQAFLDKNEYRDRNIKNRYNEIISEFKIEFTPNDIKYIIISKESERNEMINSINEIKRNFYTLMEIDELKSKIISVEQIREDF